MKARVAVILLLLSFLVLAAPYAAEPLKISGLDIPLPEGAKAGHIMPPQATPARIASYAVEMPLDEAVGFYDRFLKVNGFVIIGGMEETGYSAAVKKGAVMFTLNIYPQGGQTVIQFIW